MGVDTKRFILQHQILDLEDALVTLSGVEAREIIEDFLFNALVAGDNILISYDDIPAPGILEIGTTSDLTISGSLTFGTVISGTGDIYCNDLHTAGSSIYLGALQLSYDGSKISMPASIDTGQEVVLGTDAHVGDPAGAANVILGHQAGYYCDGDYNVVLGREAAYAHSGSTAGDYGVFLGYRAGYSLQSGNYNICIGGQAGYSLTTGGDNICIGGLAGHQISSTSYNVCIGNQAGRYNTGTGNVFLGSNAGRNNTGTNSIFIGNRAGYNETEGNKLYVDVSDTATPLIYGEFDTRLLQFNGDVFFGSNTVSGTGDIYCNDIYTSGSTVHIGDYVELSDTGSALKSNAPIAIGDLLVLSAADSGNLEVNYGIVVDGVDSSLEFTGSVASLGITDDPGLLTLSSGVVSVSADLVPTVSGSGEIGKPESPWNQIYLTDQATGESYNIVVVSGTLVVYLA